MSSRRAEYEIIEHTADAGVMAFGRTKAEAFANVARGIYSLLTDASRVTEHVRREIEVDEEDSVRLLERWLEELLFLTDTEGLLFRRFDVSIEDHRLHAVAYGDVIDPTTHELRGDIKGVTRHMTSVERVDEGGYQVRVLVDM